MNSHRQSRLQGEELLISAPTQWLLHLQQLLGYQINEIVACLLQYLVLHPKHRSEHRRHLLLEVLAELLPVTSGLFHHQQLLPKKKARKKLQNMMAIMTPILPRLYLTRML
jgi:hypothetical protein